MAEIAPEYVAARRVLLDALAALIDHRQSLILVGAQAVYVHADAADFNVPLMTTDGDLALEVESLADAPEIGALMRAAGFATSEHPGHWVGPGDVAVDLMVVPHQAGVTRRSARSARLSPHDKMTARIAHGLEPALIDNEPITVAAFEPGDSRAVDVRAAGPAALITAKAIKLGERLAQQDTRPDRVMGKDALDVFRLLQAVDTASLVAGFARHEAEPNASAASGEAMELLRAHATTERAAFPQLAAAAAADNPTVAPAFTALVARLLEALGGT